MLTNNTVDVTNCELRIANCELQRIRADELTAGDIIRHLGQTLKVYSEPRYTRRGMVFEVMPLDHQGETYQVCFDPRWTFELVDYIFDYKVGRVA